MPANSALLKQSLRAIDEDLTLLQSIPLWLKDVANIPSNLAVDKDILVALIQSLRGSQEAIEKECEATINSLSNTYTKPLLRRVYDDDDLHSSFRLSCADVGLALPTTMPYMCAIKGSNTQLRVYTRLLIDPKSHGTPLEYILPTVSRISEDMKNEHKSKAWMPTDRGLKSLYSYDDMNIERVLVRYICEDSVNAKSIDSWTTKLSNALSPMQLLIATSAEECADIYENNASKLSSCMCKDSGEARRWESAYDKSGFHPTWFYHDHPHLSVAAVLKGGKTMARVIVNTNEKYWGRIFQINSSYAAHLKKELSAVGYESYSKTYDQGELEWTVPYRKGELPMPYFDSPFNGMMLYTRKDKTKDVFHMASFHKEGYTRVQHGTAGIIHARDITSSALRTCHHCGSNVGTNMRNYCASIDVVFCDTDCARRDGYRLVRQADDTHRFKPVTDTHYYSEFNDQWYSSHYAYCKLKREGRE